jgi:hypothetical protein
MGGANQSRIRVATDTVPPYVHYLTGRVANYASVELSLRRLRPESRERIKVLAACQGGVQLSILAMLTAMEEGDV